MYSNEAEIKDLKFVQVEKKALKLFLIDENGNNDYGYYLIKSRKSIRTYKVENLTLLDMTKFPYLNKISTESVINFVLAYNRMTKERKLYLGLLGASIPLLLIGGAAGFGFGYLTYCLFNIDAFLLGLQYLLGILTAFLSAVFAIVAVAGLVLLIVSTVLLAVKHTKNKKNFFNLKNKLINQLNESNDNKLSFDLSINF